MTEEKWQRYTGSLSTLGGLDASCADQQLELEHSVDKAHDEVGVQLEAALARLETLRSDAIETRREINEHLAAAGLMQLHGSETLPGSVEAETSDSSRPRFSSSRGSGSADPDLADADPGLLLARLRDLGGQIEAQGVILAGVLRAQRRAVARAAEEDARRAELAERARARQAGIDEARREATRHRREETERARPTQPEPARKPVEQAPGGRSIMPIVWIVSLVVVIAVVLVVVFL